MQDAERAVQLNPKLTAARNLLGSLYFEAGKLKAAEQQCREALDQDPSDQQAVFRLILILRRTGDPHHELASMVKRLGKLRAEAHTEKVNLSRYRLVLAPAKDASP